MSVLTDTDALERVRLRALVATAERERDWATKRAETAEVRVAELEDSRGVLEADVSLNKRRGEQASRIENRANARVKQLMSDLDDEKRRNNRREIDLGRRASERLEKLEKAEARVAELEVERETVMGLSRDCDGTADNPVQAFCDMTQALLAACGATSGQRERAEKAEARVAELEAALAESIGQVDRLLNDHGPRIERLEQEVGE